MDTDRLLKALFDFQRFENNPALQRELDRVEERHLTRELSGEELEMVSAAGSPLLQQPLQSKERSGFV